ncbi:MAG: hypothetical protein ING19_16305 [Azospirillum sp.]|nr:hypothetical protein [Azospirillum sp.]
MTSADLGAYVLGAAIAKNNAESHARQKARMAEIRNMRERNALIQAYEQYIADRKKELSDTQDMFFYESINAAVRLHARQMTQKSLVQLIEKSKNARISESDIRVLFGHEVGPDATKIDFFLSAARQVAEQAIAAQPDHEESIRRALARIEAEKA